MGKITSIHGKKSFLRQAYSVIVSLGERRASEQKREMSQQRASIAVVTHYPPVNENSRKGNGLVGEGLSALERRRLEQELGPGGDHDVRYRFDLPPVTQQVLAWMRLLARRQRGELLS